MTRSQEILFVIEEAMSRKMKRGLALSATGIGAAGMGYLAHRYGSDLLQHFQHGDTTGGGGRGSPSHSPSHSLPSSPSSPSSPVPLKNGSGGGTALPSSPLQEHPLPSPNVEPIGKPKSGTAYNSAEDPQHQTHMQRLKARLHHHEMERDRLGRMQSPDEDPNVIVAKRDAEEAASHVPPKDPYHPKNWGKSLKHGIEHYGSYGGDRVATHKSALERVEHARNLHHNMHRMHRNAAERLAREIQDRQYPR